jgi:hypothetical protein
MVEAGRSEVKDSYGDSNVKPNNKAVARWSGLRGLEAFLSTLLVGESRASG